MDLQRNLAKWFMIVVHTFQHDIKDSEDGLLDSREACYGQHGDSFTLCRGDCFCATTAACKSGFGVPSKMGLKKD